MDQDRELMEGIDTQKKKKYYIINTLEEGDRPETPTEKLARLVRETNQLAEEITHNQKVNCSKD